MVLTICIHQHQFTSTDRDIGVVAIHSGGEGRGGEGRGGEGRGGEGRGGEGRGGEGRGGEQRGGGSEVNILQCLPTCSSYSLQCPVIGDAVQVVGSAATGHHRREGESLCPLHLHQVLHDGLQLVFLQARSRGGSMNLKRGVLTAVSTAALPPCTAA